MSFNVKSVIFDFENCWGAPNGMDIRQIDFFLGVAKLDVGGTVGYSAYATTTLDITNLPEFAFDVSLSKIDSRSYQSWASYSVPPAQGQVDQRLVIVFDSVQSFDSIVVNNCHVFGGATTLGVKDTKIHISTDAITSTVYDEVIANSLLIYDGVFAQHTAANVADDELLVLLSGDYDVPFPEIEVATDAALDIGVGVGMPEVEIVTGSAMSDVFTGTPVLMPEIAVVTGVSIEDVALFETNNSTIFYFLTLTGGADSLDDLELPMESFQANRRSGNPTFLSANVPTVDFAEQIAARPNGNIRIDQGYIKGGQVLQRETIIETALDRADVFEGGRSQTQILVGFSTATFAQKSVTLTNAISRSITDGIIRYRLAEPNIDLNPGDEVTIGDDTFTIDTMSYAIAVKTQSIDISGGVGG